MKKNDIENPELEADIADLVSKPACEVLLGIETLYQKHNVTKATIKALIKKERDKRAFAIKTFDELQNSNEITDLLQAGFIMPKDYRIEQGVVKKILVTKDSSDWHKISDFVMPIAKTINAITKDIGYKLLFKNGSELASVTVEAQFVADKNKIISLAPLGVPVHSGNALELVVFFSEFISANIQTLPVLSIVDRPGYHFINQKWVFLLGKKVFPSEFVNSIEKSSTNDAGVDQHYEVCGDEKIWTEQIKYICEFPVPLFIIGTTTSGPLLDILDVANIIIHTRGRSTTGKTVVMECSASFFGNPNRNGLVKAWNTTSVGLESRMVNANSTALWCDDFSTADGKLNKEHTIYFLSEGTGKQRGKKDGSTRLGSVSKFVIVSNGEETLIENQTKDGGKIRVIETSGPLFGESSPQTGERLKALKNDIRKNYGHAALKLIPFFLKIRNDSTALEELQNKFKFSVNRILACSQSEFASRVSSYFAAVETALHCLAEVYPELELTKKQIEKAVDVVFEMQSQRYSTANMIDMRALTYVVDKIIAEPHRFTGNTAPFTQSWGRRIKRKLTGNTGIAFFPTAFRQLLTDGGFEPQSIIDFLKERHVFWENENSILYPVRFDDMVKKSFVIDVNRLVELGLLEEESVVGLENLCGNESEAPF